MLGWRWPQTPWGRASQAVYGRAHDSVTDLYAIMRSGERVDWPIHHDPRNQERYFAIIADCQELKDIIALAGRRRASLKDNFGIWFRTAPWRLARCSHSWAAETYPVEETVTCSQLRRPLDPANRVGARQGAEVAPPRPGLRLGCFWVSHVGPAACAW